MKTPDARKPKTPGLVLGAGLSLFLSSVAFPALAQGQPTMTPEAFEASKDIYFQQCAGCHGVLRKGATGKHLLPEKKATAADGTVTTTGTLALGQDRLERIISYGTDGGMNNFDGILTAEEIKGLATYIQIDPPKPPEWSLAQMKATRKVHVEPADYPTAPLHDRNWENFLVVIEREVGKVAVIDGDTREVLVHIPTGYAVHVLKASEHHSINEPENPGRFWYAMGHDGKMTKIDLWQTPDKMLVAKVDIAHDARDVAVSGDGKYVIGGGYWPRHFVIVDAVTMEPLKAVSTRGVNVDGDYVEEARVAAIYTTPHESTWVVAIKELGQIWQVDYTDLDNLRIDKIDNSRFLHDGFFDPTGRYFQIAANASNQMVVIDTKTRKLEATIDTKALPHPGPGANWIDPNCGPVGGTTRLGTGHVTVWGNDPINRPDDAWKICYEVETDGPGLFIRTHETSDYIRLRRRPLRIQR